MKHTRCMFHFCFQCFIFAFNVSFLLSMFHFTSIDDKKRNLVQEIQNEGLKSNLKHETLNFIRQTI